MTKRPIQITVQGDISQRLSGVVPPGEPDLQHSSFIFPPDPNGDGTRQNHELKSDKMSRGSVNMGSVVDDIELGYDDLRSELGSTIPDDEFSTDISDDTDTEGIGEEPSRGPSSPTISNDSQLELGVRDQSGATTEGGKNESSIPRSEEKVQSVDSNTSTEMPKEFEKRDRETQMADIGSWRSGILSHSLEEIISKGPKTAGVAISSDTEKPADDKQRSSGTTSQATRDVGIMTDRESILDTTETASTGEWEHSMMSIVERMTSTQNKETQALLKMFIEDKNKTREDEREWMDKTYKSHLNDVKSLMSDFSAARSKREKDDMEARERKWQEELSEVKRLLASTQEGPSRAERHAEVEPPPYTPLTVGVTPLGTPRTSLSPDRYSREDFGASKGLSIPPDRYDDLFERDNLPYYVDRYPQHAYFASDSNRPTHPYHRHECSVCPTNTVISPLLHSQPISPINSWNNSQEVPHHPSFFPFDCETSPRGVYRHPTTTHHTPTLNSRYQTSHHDFGGNTAWQPCYDTNCSVMPSCPIDCYPDDQSTVKARSRKSVDSYFDTAFRTE